MTGLVSLRSPPDHTALTPLFLSGFPPEPGRDLVTCKDGSDNNSSNMQAALYMGCTGIRALCGYCLLLLPKQPVSWGSLELLVSNARSRKMRPERLAKRPCLRVLRTRGPGLYFFHHICPSFLHKASTEKVNRSSRPRAGLKSVEGQALEPVSPELGTSSPTTSVSSLAKWE